MKNALLIAGGVGLGLGAAGVALWLGAKKRTMMPSAPITDETVRALAAPNGLDLSDEDQITREDSEGGRPPPGAW